MTHGRRVRNSKFQPVACSQQKHSKCQPVERMDAGRMDAGTQGQKLKVLANRTHRRRDARTQGRRVRISKCQPAECMNAGRMNEKKLEELTVLNRNYRKVQKILLKLAPKIKGKGN